MATIIHKYKEIEVEDESSIMQVSQDFGVLFACKMGKCGSCKITIISGMENLSSKSACEDLLGLDENERLACRCSISQREVEIDF